MRADFKIQDRDDLRDIREKVTNRLLTLDRALERRGKYGRSEQDQDHDCDGDVSAPAHTARQEGGVAMSRHKGGPPIEVGQATGGT